MPSLVVINGVNSWVEHMLGLTLTSPGKSALVESARKEMCGLEMVENCCQSEEAWWTVSAWGSFIDVQFANHDLIYINGTDSQNALLVKYIFTGHRSFWESNAFYLIFSCLETHTGKKVLRHNMISVSKTKNGPLLLLGPAIQFIKQTLLGQAVCGAHAKITSGRAGHF